MPDIFNAAGLTAIFSPAILFFVLGAVAAVARSDLSIPEAATKTLSLYLMLCIGFKGGVEARAAGFSIEFFTVAVIGVLLSAATPVLAYALLRRFTRLNGPTLCALAATYGSVSVVTFVAGAEYLTSLGQPPSGYMTAVLALMEAPAILTALLILNRGTNRRIGMPVLREVLFNAASALLIGSFVIGMTTGEKGMGRLELFVGPLFQGALCLFLLDMGLIAARRLLDPDNRLSAGVVAFALAFPLSSALFAVLVARTLGVAPPDAAMLGVLAASGSYIAVPAAMRLAAPQADQGVFVTSALTLTFPFNLFIGIPVIGALAFLL